MSEREKLEQEAIELIRKLNGNELKELFERWTKMLQENL